MTTKELEELVKRFPARKMERTCVICDDPCGSIPGILSSRAMWQLVLRFLQGVEVVDGDIRRLPVPKTQGAPLGISRMLASFADEQREVGGEPV